LNQLLIPNGGFKDASYKNWLLQKIFYKRKFTALAQDLVKPHLECSVYRALKQLKIIFGFI